MKGLSANRKRLRVMGIAALSHDSNILTIATICVGDVMADQNRLEQFAQAAQRDNSLDERAKRTLDEKPRHEEWTQRLDEDWQDHLETLQKYVCELLVKNQRLRMALKAINQPEHGHADVIKL
jgi:hypothetical protein